MKMGFSAVVGAFFVLMGVGMILRAFGIDIHLTRIAVALFVIFIGVKMLFPKAMRRHASWDEGAGGDVVFSQSQTRHADSASGRYNVVFGSQKVDLTKVDLSKGDVKVEANAAFGSIELALDPKTPVKVVANSAFGSVELPGGNSAVFGTQTFRSPSYKESAPALLIDANAAFGSIEVR